MRRFLGAGVPVAVMVAVLYVIASAGSARHATATSPSMLPPVQRAASRPTATPPAASTPAPGPAPAVTTAPRAAAIRTGCRWRLYHDGAIAADPACAPGQLDRAVIGHPARTICNPAWLAAAGRPQPAASTKDELLYEYQLPGNPVTYTVAHVIPVEDGGSATSAQNLYPLPVNGFGGQETRTLVAGELHDEICSHKITVAQATGMLEGDWLSKGLPNHD